MDKANVSIADRLVKIFKDAEKEAKISKYQVLQPAHLLLASIKQKTGALGEINLKCTLQETTLREIIENGKSNTKHRAISYDLFNMAVTEDVVNVMEVAFNYMERYNQIYLNEGHLLKALIKTGVVDSFLTEEDREIIMNLGTTARDMITHLGAYTFPNITSNAVRKVNKSDENNLVHFVEKNFSKGWSQTIREGFSSKEPTIYIALDTQGDIIGFAAFDVYKNKKGYFGPMGVTQSNRIKGIGYSLLHYCLKDMRDIGYEYAIIGGAGPMEFYEKACGAVVIPSNCLNKNGS
ncbi:GNAT family N-acetyltransferase [Virgibacillus doumboii]|uniref:GNAT family N-acetyltransferase n=1 Tax=Virgibacillus doumboii TaxID=2697503 RepID=UPI0013DF0D11|nr:GNAT family N-acetyltransferase [Virgibacillus doumboii]